MSSPIFGARIPDDLRSRLESHMTQTERSKSELLIEALGQYLDGLDGTARAVGVAPAVDRQLAEMDERLAAIEEMLLEEYVEPQPRYVKRLRPVRGGVVGLRR
jgi:predicted DNA-binding protein